MSASASISEYNCLLDVEIDSARSIYPPQRVTMMRVKQCQQDDDKSESMPARQ